MSKRNFVQSATRSQGDRYDAPFLDARDEEEAFRSYRRIKRRWVQEHRNSQEKVKQARITLVKLKFMNFVSAADKITGESK